MQEEGWVVCRVFKKRMAATRRELGGEHDSLCWYDDQVAFMPDFDPSPRRISSPYASPYPYNNYTCKQELELQYSNNMPPNNNHDVNAFLQLPNLESPKLQQSTGSSSMVHYGFNEDHMQENDRTHQNELYSNVEGSNDQVTDWRVLDKFVASQLSQDEEACVQVSDQMRMNVQDEMKGQDELNSISTTSTSQVDLWN